MAWCPHCSQHSQTHYDYTTGSICCVECGKVINQCEFTEDTEFVKDSAGHAHAAGNIVRSANASAVSHERTLNKGKDVISSLIDKYGINDVSHAINFYKMAVERGFTRGRRTNQVAAACLYVACREMDKPFLLIEFSSELGISVYELGTVYLQLCKLLSLQDHSFIQKPVDPSLFMHRYTSGLVKDGSNRKILNTTALHLVVSMKRDWIQTGRKPSGICAAAIYVSSVLHGYNFTKSDVVKAVHICEATLTKRLIEFENTEAGSLTIEEFTQNALDYENEMQSCKQIANDLKMPGTTEVVCEHKRSAAHSGFGLCKECYMEFCGGLYGSEPPAFQRAEIERFSKESVKRLTGSTSQNEDHNENGAQNNTKEIDNIGSSTEAEHVAPDSGKPDKTSDDADGFENSKEAPFDETHTLEDIDDCEVISYLLDEEESRLKKKIWENLDGNREYMQEQAVKDAAKVAAAEAKLKLSTGTPEEIRKAQAIAAAAAQEVANRKQRDKRKRELEAKNAKPAQTAAEAASQHFNKKKLSNKINHEALNSIFGDEEPNSEKIRVDDGSKKGGEIMNEDNNNNEDGDDNNNNDENDDELNYDKEQQMNGGYGDDDFGDDGYEGF